MAILRTSGMTKIIATSANPLLAEGWRDTVVELEMHDGLKTSFSPGTFLRSCVEIYKKKHRHRRKVTSHHFFHFFDNFNFHH